jgi:hypothetical protein
MNDGRDPGSGPKALMAAAFATKLAATRRSAAHPFFS